MPREHPCRDCGDTFLKASNLSRHYREKHGDSRYECPVCQKASFKRRENLLEKHIRYAHEEVYDKMKENKLRLLRPLQPGASRLHTPGIENAKSQTHKKRSQSSCSPLPGKKRMAKSPSWATKENEHKATQHRQRNEDLAPLSPSTAQVCDNIIAGAVTTAKQDLFPGKAVTYSPLNLDGTRPESNREYYPTPLITFPKSTKIRPVEIPISPIAGSSLQDPRSFKSQVKPITVCSGKETCEHGITLPVMEVEQEVVPGGKKEILRINCTKCPIPHYLQHKLVQTAAKASEAKVETKERGCDPAYPEIRHTGCDPVCPILQETGCDPICLELVEVGCDPKTPEVIDCATAMEVYTKDTSTAMAAGDTPGEIWVREQLDAVGLHISEESSSEDSDESDINDFEGQQKFFFVCLFVSPNVRDATF